MSDIQDKIRKLLALANNAAATEGEAVNALAMASALMAKYNIEHIEEKSSVDYNRRPYERMFHPWQNWIMTVCGKLNGCKPITGKTTYSFVGRKEATDAAWQMYDFICHQIERLYKRDLPPRLSVKDRANFRRSYKQAAAIRVYQRAEEILQRLRTQDQVISGCTALVVAQTFDQMLNEAEQFLEGKGIVKMLYDVKLIGGGHEWNILVWAETAEQALRAAFLESMHWSIGKTTPEATRDVLDVDEEFNEFLNAKTGVRIYHEG